VYLFLVISPEVWLQLYW